MIQPRLVLVMADDSDPDVALFRIALKKSDLSAVLFIVKDGEELLLFLKKEPPFETALTPNLIFLDIAMPNMNGIEALKQIKQDRSLAIIPVVMLTNSNREEDVLSSYEYHANSYIVKPGSVDIYKEVIDSISEYWFSTARLPGKLE